jgi:hypothetical protein
VLAHPELQNLRHWTLYTEDAHELYRRFGFVVEPRPDKHMVYRPPQREIKTIMDN